MAASVPVAAAAAHGEGGGHGERRTVCLTNSEGLFHVQTSVVKPSRERVDAPGNRLGGCSVFTGLGG